MGRKKKRSAPNARDRIFCYYCDRTFQNEQELLMHQREKHLRCPTCHKRMLSVPSLMIHASQMHNSTLPGVPNGIAGRDGTDLDVLGMKGIPQSYYDGLEGSRPHGRRLSPQNEADRTAANYYSSALVSVPSASPSQFANPHQPFHQTPRQPPYQPPYHQPPYHQPDQQPYHQPHQQPYHQTFQQSYPQQPYPQQPYAQPYAQQPYAQQPYAQHPYAQQPYAQQPYQQPPFHQQHQPFAHYGPPHSYRTGLPHAFTQRASQALHGKVKSQHPNAREASRNFTDAGDLGPEKANGSVYEKVIFDNLDTSVEELRAALPRYASK